MSEMVSHYSQPQASRLAKSRWRLRFQIETQISTQNPLEANRSCKHSKTNALTRWRHLNHARIKEITTGSGSRNPGLDSRPIFENCHFKPKTENPSLGEISELTPA